MKENATFVIKAAQVFLFPVAIVTQEELMASFRIFSHFKYSPKIMSRHPGATKWKFIVATGARFVDGLLFLFLNITVMFLTTRELITLFLNFASLQFLQTIDAVALQVCLDGYWTKSLQESAQDVVDMKLVYRHHNKHRVMLSSFIFVTWAVILCSWANAHFNMNLVMSGD